MNFKIGIILLFPLILAAQLEDPEETGGFFEGDIELTEDQQQELFQPTQSRNGIRSEKYRWPKKTVLYKISSEFDSAHVDYILRGMRTIEKESCIRYEEVKDPLETAYVFIQAGSTGCHSSVGYLNKIQNVTLQIFPLDEGCFRLGTIVHELLHSLGFYHEQSSWNRDDFVEVKEENILEGKEHNFRKYTEKQVTDFGVGYDYGSVLHYSGFAFTKNGEATIVPKLTTKDIMGQRVGMSKKDILKLRMMYKCPFYV